MDCRQLQVTATAGRIHPEQIADGVAAGLAATFFRAIARAYQDPAVRADFEKWKERLNNENTF